MPSADLLKALIAVVRPRLNEKGFVFQAAPKRFIRERDEIIDRFQLVCVDAKPGWQIRPHVGVRIECVENIFHQTSGFEPKYEKDTSTFGTAAESLTNGSTGVFVLESESQVAAVAEEILNVFREVALPYFERWGSLAAIDAELNNSPGERTLHRALAWYRCSTGIIVAKLVGRPNYEELAAFYTEVMTKDNKGFYLKRFEALLKSLEKV
jgi:hypothetical protein